MLVCLSQNCLVLGRDLLAKCYFCNFEVRKMYCCVFLVFCLSAVKCQGFRDFLFFFLPWWYNSSSFQHLFSFLFQRCTSQPQRKLEEENSVLVNILLICDVCLFLLQISCFSPLFTCSCAFQLEDGLNISIRRAVDLCDFCLGTELKSVEVRCLNTFDNLHSM